MNYSIIIVNSTRKFQEVFNLVDNILDSQHMQAWDSLKSVGDKMSAY